MTAELTAEVYGRYTKNRKWKKKRTNNYRKSDKTVSRTFDLSNAFIVLRIYCSHSMTSIPPFFTTFRSPKKATIVNIFGNFYGNDSWTA